MVIATTEILAIAIGSAPPMFTVYRVVLVDRLPVAGLLVLIDACAAYAAARRAMRVDPVDVLCAK